MLDGDNRERLIAQLKWHEGSRRDKNGRHIVYLCPAGHRTIGYGHNLDASPRPSLLQGREWITDAEAQTLLANDINLVDAELAARMSRAGMTYLDIDPVRRAVMINMGFNMGVPKLMKFADTWDAIRRGDYQQASVEMLDSAWARQVKARARELAEQMRTGRWMGQWMDA